MFTTKFKVLVAVLIFIAVFSLLSVELAGLNKRVKALEMRRQDVLVKTVIVTPTASPTATPKFFRAVVSPAAISVTPKK